MRVLFYLPLALAGASIGFAPSQGNTQESGHYGATLPQLVCAAGLSCNGPETNGINAEDAAIVLGVDGGDETIQQVVDGSYNYDNEIWLCAGDGPCAEWADPELIRDDLGLSLEQVGYIIQLRPDLAARMPQTIEPEKPDAPEAVSDLDLSGRYHLVFRGSNFLEYATIDGDQGTWGGLHRDVPLRPITFERTSDGVLLTFTGLTHDYILPGPYLFYACQSGACLARSKQGKLGIVLHAALIAKPQ
ncbi:hypothetical protein [Fulvimarina sp. MAC8]|uniref:hypothetical protein n=1 Tax=Fulvimarina sp. MAC8 TaxID=3162874 RepID=UPI0032EE8713